MVDKINLIDIGSLGGLDLPWSKNRKHIGKLLCFEPNEELIIEPDFIKYNSAIWSYDGNAKFFISGLNGSGSSLLKQNFDWVKEHFEEIKDKGNHKLNETWFERSQIKNSFSVEVKKLDTVLEEINLKMNQPIRFHFLKSDTQSGEGYVLQGAEKFLEENCLGLELELFRYPLYEDIIIDKKIKEYLKKFNFGFAGWSGLKNSFNSQYDALFIKKTTNKEDLKIIDLILKIYRPKGKNLLIKQKSIIDKFKNRITNLLH